MRAELLLIKTYVMRLHRCRWPQRLWLRCPVHHQPGSFAHFSSYKEKGIFFSSFFEEKMEISFASF